MTTPTPSTHISELKSCIIAHLNEGISYHKKQEYVNAVKQFRLSVEAMNKVLSLDPTNQRDIDIQQEISTNLYSKLYSKMLAVSTDHDVGLTLPPNIQAPSPSPPSSHQQPAVTSPASQVREMRKLIHTQAQQIAQRDRQLKAQQTRLHQLTQPSRPQPHKDLKPRIAGRVVGTPTPRRPSAQRPTPGARAKATPRRGARPAPSAKGGKPGRRPSGGRFGRMGIPAPYIERLQASKAVKALKDEQLEGIISCCAFPDSSPTFSDIIGMDSVKEALRQSIIIPQIRKDLYTGNRQPPKGLLVMGPPGNGKTLLARAAANEAGVPMLAMSASSVMDKWVGASEKNVKNFFIFAHALAPCILFLDEADSLLSARRAGENDSSRRVKTEFLTLTQGVLCSKEHTGLLLVAATNLPQEIDDAARRRFDTRLYVPLPSPSDRAALLKMLVARDKNTLTGRQIQQLAARTDRYSFSDISQLAKRAALVPLSSVTTARLSKMKEIRPVSYADYEVALRQVTPSVSAEYLRGLFKWAADNGISVR
eukprot:gnl/Dysnectes_brevis/381_a423_2355.p1 GENE.gnl/Dysnectes_brevis/381_a423_2355~~gnl/Dysnectes_brevis/381_a423_2355.p1  ORF type:complete len:536 (+),score=119.13 gnl/Dysnectes_brevis/381_a423_2355:582-2189(+)